jgi:hypothetical protein
MLRKSKYAVVGYRIYDNWRTKQRFKSGNTESFLGSTHRGRKLSESLSYINAQFDDYVKYWGHPQSSLAGKRILEIGFGDNIGVALRFIAAGASFVACLDKFYAKRDTEQEGEIYAALRETLDEEAKKRFDEALDANNRARSNPDKIKCIYGVDVEDSEELKSSPPFDLVISRGAIQDIYSPEKAFVAMDKLLAPGGYMLHKIDLSDQGMFRNRGLNPLTFLTIGESVYRLMAEGSGRPNRKLIQDYRSILEKLGYEYELLITDVVGRSGKGNLEPHQKALDPGADYVVNAKSLVQQIRPRLAGRFRKLSDEELMISGIFVVARKPTSADS